MTVTLDNTSSIDLSVSTEDIKDPIVETATQKTDEVAQNTIPTDTEQSSKPILMQGEELTAEEIGDSELSIKAELIAGKILNFTKTVNSAFETRTKKIENIKTKRKEIEDAEKALKQEKVDLVQAKQALIDKKEQQSKNLFHELKDFTPLQLGAIQLVESPLNAEPGLLNDIGIVWSSMIGGVWNSETWETASLEEQLGAIQNLWIPQRQPEEDFLNIHTAHFNTIKESVERLKNASYPQDQYALSLVVDRLNNVIKLGLDRDPAMMIEMMNRILENIPSSDSSIENPFINELQNIRNLITDASDYRNKKMREKIKRSEKKIADLEEKIKINENIIAQKAEIDEKMKLIEENRFHGLKGLPLNSDGENQEGYSSLSNLNAQPTILSPILLSDVNAWFECFNSSSWKKASPKEKLVAIRNLWLNDEERTEIHGTHLKVIDKSIENVLKNSPKIDDERFVDLLKETTLLALRINPIQIQKIWETHYNA